MVTVESRNIEQAQREATATQLPDPATVKGRILEFALWLRKQGRNEETCKTRAYLIRRLINLGANPWNPESVKEVLAKQKTWSNGYKMIILYAYESFLKMEGLTWERPAYKQDQCFPFIPTEAELVQLIAVCSHRIGTFLQGLKDTGADPGELAALRWIDINKENRTISIQPVKGHKPRILSVSREFMDRLERLPKTSEKVFSYENIQQKFGRQRRRAAYKLENPRLQKISFTTFRHWKATMEYHRTKDILYVQKLLGHRRIDNTLKYIDLETALYGATDEQFTVRVATNVQEASGLAEAGFEYITGEYADGGKIFRKRK